MKTHYAQTIYWALCLGAAALASITGAQEPPTVTMALEKNEVFVGEPFLLQIQVSNVNEAEAPDLANLSRDLTIEYDGSGSNNTSSIGFINGRTTRQVSRQYLINYRLTAKRAGRIEIPSITVTAGGQTLTTQPVTVQANAPKPLNNFRLSTSLSKSECYVGEPILMTTKYHFNSNLEEIAFTLGALTSGDFQAEALHMRQQPDRNHPQIPVNGEGVIAEVSEVQLDTGTFAEITFQHTLVPRTVGTISIPEATAAARVRSGRSLFAEPKSIVVQSEALTLSVLPVPEEGRPANFSGLIGAFRISAEASPTEVNVGDPITLTVTIEGSSYLRHFELPPLQQQTALAGDFRIPEEMAPGRTEENRKVFTQTIRAESTSVTEIPPLELAYFDTSTGSYSSAATKAIPLKVRESQIVTASDAEGFRQSVETVEHVAVNEGIAHNFTEPDALDAQHFGPDVWMRSRASWMLLLLPPIAWGTLAGAMLFRRIGGIRPKGRTRKLARAQLGSALADLNDADGTHGKALQTLRAYLAAKLDANPGALTYADVEPPLRAQGASDATLELLKRILDECEAHHYAGAGGIPAAEVAAHVLECADALEKEIG